MIEAAVCNRGHEMHTKKNNLIFALSVLTVSLLLLAGCTTQNSNSGNNQTDNPKNQHAIIGITLTPTSTLLHIADEKGFFKKNGVDVELKEFSSGKLAFQS